MMYEVLFFRWLRLNYERKILSEAYLEGIHQSEQPLELPLL